MEWTYITPGEDPEYTGLKTGAESGLAKAEREEDKDNLSDLLAMGANPAKTHLFLPFVGYGESSEVPDPYYGGEDGFQDVVILIRDAATKLVLKLCA